MMLCTQADLLDDSRFNTILGALRSLIDEKRNEHHHDWMKLEQDSLYNRAMAAYDGLVKWDICFACKKEVRLRVMTGYQYDKTSRYGAASNTVYICPECNECNGEVIC